ncbi:MAG: CPBP family intramembrane metalloprotease [Coriobacteriales bacterium]|nr:CPBP family intramembrane metalloprotease [Coriobacteriales bacterium]
MVLSFIALLVVVVFEAVGIILAEFIGTDPNLTVTVSASIGASLSMLALGAGASLVPSRPALRDALRYGWWLLAANGLFALYDLVAIFVDPEFSLAENWLLSSLWTLLYCLTVGIHEELAFRGLILGGLLSKFGGTKRGMLVSCLVSSLIFASAHVDWFSLDYADPMSLVQALLKIAQMCIFGLIMAAIVMRTNNMVGPILLHALGDFVLLLPSVGLMGISLEVSYVSGGDDAIPTIVLYLIIIALYQPLLFFARRLLSTAEPPQYGPLRQDKATPSPKRISR